MEIINLSLITLIPKKVARRGDFRLIMLLNCSLQIISKILVNRITSILQDMIQEYEMGFIPRRYILEGVAVAIEVIHQYRKSNSYIYMLKLDFEKAYDLVDWNCWMEMLC